MDSVYIHLSETIKKIVDIPDILDETLNIIHHKKAKFPEFVGYNERLNSYDDWSFSNKQSAETLANSGFFYTNLLDFCKCFACGLRLGDWKEEHNPDIQHLHYRRKCLYMKLKDRLHPDSPQIKTCVVCMFAWIRNLIMSIYRVGITAPVIIVCLT